MTSSGPASSDEGPLRDPMSPRTPSTSSAPPEDLTPYTVQAADTLTSIAARYDVTPTELAKLNRLTTRLVFPGQVLSVPEKTEAEQTESSPAPDDHPEGADLLAGILPPPSGSKPGHIERVSGPGVGPESADTPVDEDLDKECLEKFLKINVRHITDGQGVVSGVLLVTPNALMFDPNVSDPLVIEHGSEAYGVIAPMEFVVSSALYTDIAHMKVRDRGNVPLPSLPKPEVYRPKKEKSPDIPVIEEDRCTPPPPSKTDPVADAVVPPLPDTTLSKDLTFPELALKSSVEEDTGSECSYGGGTAPRDGVSAFPKAFDRDLVSPEPDDALNKVKRPAEEPKPEDVTSRVRRQPTEERERSARIEDIEEVDEKEEEKRSTVWFDVPEKKEAAESSSTESRKQKVLKRLSYPLSWMESFSGERDSKDDGSGSGSAPPSADFSTHSKSVFSNVMSNVSSMSNVIASSPRYIVDFSSGLFARPPDDGGGVGGAKIRDLADLGTPPSLEHIFGNTGSADAGRRSGNSTFYTERTSLDFSKKTPPPTRQATVGATSSKMGYKSMVSVDDMPELFAAFDKLIPKPARSCGDPPLYLCLKMGKKKGQSISRTVSIMTYGRKKMKAEYWYSIPRERCDELYQFFQHWAPQTYGDLESTKPEDRGYELVDSDTELFDDDVAGADSANVEGDPSHEMMDTKRLEELTNQSWEMVSMSEELRHALYSTSMTSMDFDYLPELKGKSEIFTEEHRKKLCKKLLPRAEGYPWTLVFSTSQHGFSLKSMYRKLHELECPILVLVEDTYSNIFGVMSSCSLSVSEHFYGTGESFLFTFYPEFRVFPWTGDNLYFVKGNMESIAFGAGDGKFGLWLDGDLYQGRTRPCQTYRNDPLSSNEDFVVKTLECWGFL